MNFTELFSAQVIAANWTEAASNRIPYLGETLFPKRKKAGLDLSWLKGYKGIPISLKPSAFDADATFRDRIAFTKLETEMPFFREGFKIKEKDRQEILRAMDSADPYAKDVIARIFDDAQDLIDGANVVPERMIMQLLFPSTGNVGINITANNVKYTYNYDPNGEWKKSNYKALTGNAAWTAAATADPFHDMQVAQDAIRDKTGSELATAVMSTATFRALTAIAEVKARFITANGQSVGYLTGNEVRNVVKGVTGLDVALYDKSYRDEAGAAHKFVPDGYVAFIPSGALGNTWYGTTPEEADLMLGKTAAEVSIVNTGVAVTTETTVNPVNVNTYASEIVLPSFERLDEFYSLKVW